jgi:hypothetical protein
MCDSCRSFAESMVRSAQRGGPQIGARAATTVIAKSNFMLAHLPRDMEFSHACSRPLDEVRGTDGFDPAYSSEICYSGDTGRIEFSARSPNCKDTERTNWRKAAINTSMNSRHRGGRQCAAPVVVSMAKSVFQSPFHSVGSPRCTRSCSLRAASRALSSSFIRLEFDQSRGAQEGDVYRYAELRLLLMPTKAERAMTRAAS